MVNKRLTAAEARQDGLDAEAQVIDWLVDNGYNIHIPSIEINRKYDIDAFLVSTDDEDDTPMTSVSIKANTPEYFNSPFLFELEQGWKLKEGKESQPIRGNMRTLEEFTDDNGKSFPIHRVKTWWYTGRASQYLIYKRDTQRSGKLFAIDRQKVHDFVKTYSFDAITETKGNAKSRELREGKVFTKVGLLDQDRLLSNGIAEYIGYIHDKEGYEYEF